VQSGIYIGHKNIFCIIHMPRLTPSVHSRQASEAVALLAGAIKSARLEKRMTAQELAERAGVSRGLVRRIEAGDLACSIGTVFELAALTGVALFGRDPAELRAKLEDTRKTLHLLPKTARHLKLDVDDDF
jgi:transcriptional regulator with XRE-family HTH domain